MSFETAASALAYQAAHEQELIDLIKELCRIPAPSHREEKRAAFVKTWFEENSFANVTVDDALNVIAPVNCTEGCDVVIFMAHTDTVFPDM